MQFDTIYHEHFSYLSLHTIEKCSTGTASPSSTSSSCPTHGGSSGCRPRTVVPRRPRVHDVERAAEERSAGIATLEAYTVSLQG